MLIEKLRDSQFEKIDDLDELVSEIGEQQSHFNEVFELLFHEKGPTRAIAAQVVMKISEKHPQLIEAKKPELFKLLPRVQFSEVKIFIAQIIPNLRLESHEQKFASDLLFHWLKSEVRNEQVKLSCMQALSEMAFTDPFLRPEVIMEIESQMFRGEPAVRSRGQKLLAKLRGITF